MKQLWLEHRRTFGKSQVTALFATAIDYSCLLFLVEILGVYYVPAVAAAALLGAVANFLANRIWAFGSAGMLGKEAVRYGITSLGSLAWNVLLVWLVTSQLGLVYYFSKIAVGIFVGIVWNYPLHKYWVFLPNSKKNDIQSTGVKESIFSTR